MPFVDGFAVVVGKIDAIGVVLGECGIVNEHVAIERASVSAGENVAARLPHI